MKRLLLACLALCALACGGTEKYLIPVDSPIRPWQPPELEREELEEEAPPAATEDGGEDPGADTGGEAGDAESGG